MYGGLTKAWETDGYWCGILCCGKRTSVASSTQPPTFVCILWLLHYVGLFFNVHVTSGHMLLHPAVPFLGMMKLYVKVVILANASACGEIRCNAAFQLSMGSFIVLTNIMTILGLLRCGLFACAAVNMEVFYEVQALCCYLDLFGLF